MKVIFLGTPDFAAHILHDLLMQGIDVAAVVTKPDRPKGRSLDPVPTPVKLVALAHQPPVPVYQPEKASQPGFSEVLAPYQADLFVVVAYGEILKPHLLTIAKYGCINVHPSLLPKYRGSAPIQRSIMEGDQETGVTIMRLSEKMDAGDILKVVKMPISLEATYGELEKKLCEAGSKALVDVIHSFEKGPLEGIKQDHTQATPAPKIELEECQIDWKKPSHFIHNLVRGVNPQPGAWTWVDFKGKRLRLKINRTKPHRGHGNPGTIIEYGNAFVVACGEGSLEVLDLQLEGKRAMSAQEFMRGIAREQLLFP